MFTKVSYCTKTKRQYFVSLLCRYFTADGLIDKYTNIRTLHIKYKPKLHCWLPLHIGILLIYKTGYPDKLITEFWKKTKKNIDFSNQQIAAYTTNQHLARAEESNEMPIGNNNTSSGTSETSKPMKSQLVTSSTRLMSRNQYAIKPVSSSSSAFSSSSKINFSFSSRIR